MNLSEEDILFAVNCMEDIRAVYSCVDNIALERRCEELIEKLNGNKSKMTVPVLLSTEEFNLLLTALHLLDIKVPDKCEPLIEKMQRNRSLLRDTEKRMRRMEKLI